MIRLAKLTDLEIIHKINLEVQANPWSMEAIQDELKLNSFSSFIWEDDGVVGGYLLLRPLDQNFEIMSIGVDKKYQKRGVGTKLMDQAIGFCQRTQGTQALYLEVSHLNESAISLYKRSGFIPGRVRKNYYRDGSDALEMSLSLLGIS